MQVIEIHQSDTFLKDPLIDISHLKVKIIYLLAIPVGYTACHHVRVTDCFHLVDVISLDSHVKYGVNRVQ